MHQPSKFWDKLVEGYAKRPVADEASYQKKLQVTRKYLRPDMEVLEFGAGTGSTAIAHAPYVKHIEAIDVSPKMIEIARGKADANNVENVTFRPSSIDELSAADQSFDAVLGLSILHLLDNKEEVISKVHRMLKPGGTALVVEVRSNEDEGHNMETHRLGEMTIVAQFEEGGFTFVEQSEILRVEGDDYTVYGGPTGPRYTTDRMLMTFRKGQ